MPRNDHGSSSTVQATGAKAEFNPHEEQYEDVKSHYPVDSPLEEGEIRLDLDAQLDTLGLETEEQGHVATLIDASITDDPISHDDPTQPSPRKSKVSHAWSEAKHFAGGLIAHPYEATKHYSILRHSHGLVFYQGPSTSIAVTVFSDQPLPEQRKLWLQKRGYSGNIGLRIGATVGSRSAWIDVTPNAEATAELLPQGDERAWQRDILKFTKKTKKVKNTCNHRPYETDVVRIPHTAEDGYFRIVLCAGDKVLCPSPILRYASSSLDPSMLRGASLATLPLELGIRIGVTIVKTAANTAAHGAIQPAVTTVKNVAQPYELDGFTQWAANTAYDTSGAGDKVDQTVATVNAQYDQRREVAKVSASGEVVTVPAVVGAEEGPERPYPIRLSGKVAPASAKHHTDLGVSTAKLTDVSDDTMLRLSGAYMGWALISKASTTAKIEGAEEMYRVWHQAVVVADVAREAKVKVVQQKQLVVHIMHGSEIPTFVGAKVQVMIMGFLHPLDAASPDVSKITTNPLSQMLFDIETTSRSLSRTNWAPEALLERIKSDFSSRSLTERLADARHSGQQQVDKIPIHKLGVCMNSMGLRDELIGTGGICVKRQ